MDKMILEAKREVLVAYYGLRLCVCLPLAQGFNLKTNLMGK